MWRIGVLLVSVLVQLSLAEVHPGAHETILQRLKRSPQYCGPGYPPPPPPPPFWPPPPPPPQQYWQPPPRPHWPHPPPPQYEVYTASDSQSGAGQAGGQCTTCGGSGESSATSNAESGTGEAIAVAVAKARSSGK